MLMMFEKGVVIDNKTTTQQILKNKYTLFTDTLWIFPIVKIKIIQGSESSF